MDTAAKILIMVVGLACVSQLEAQDRRSSEIDQLNALEQQEAQLYEGLVDNPNREARRNIRDALDDIDAEIEVKRANLNMSSRASQSQQHFTESSSYLSRQESMESALRHDARLGEGSENANERSVISGRSEIRAYRQVEEPVSPDAEIHNPRRSGQ